MGEDTPQTITLTCTGCSTSFRLTPRLGSRLPEALACPRCQTAIVVPPQDSEYGWSRLPHSRVFNKRQVSYPQSSHVEQPIQAPEPLDPSKLPNQGLKLPTDGSSAKLSGIFVKAPAQAGALDRTSPTLSPNTSETDDESYSEPSFVFDEDIEPSNVENHRLDQFVQRLPAPRSTTDTSVSAEAPVSESQAFHSQAPHFQAPEAHEPNDQIFDQSTHNQQIEPRESLPQKKNVTPVRDNNLSPSAHDEIPTGASDVPITDSSSYRKDITTTEPAAISPRANEELLITAPDRGTSLHAQQPDDVTTRDVASGTHESMDTAGTSSPTIILSRNAIEKSVLQDRYPTVNKGPERGDDNVESVSAEPAIDQTDVPLERINGSHSQSVNTDNISATDGKNYTEHALKSRRSRSFPRRFTFAVTGIVILATAAWFHVYINRESSTPSTTAITVVQNAPVSDANSVEDASQDSPDINNPVITSIIHRASTHIKNAYEISPFDLVEAILAQHHHTRARSLLVELAQHDVDEHLVQELFNRTLLSDPRFSTDVQTIGKDIDIDSIHALGGGNSVSFRLTQNGVNRFAFKGSQKDWLTWWKVEIAAYNLCQILPCHFEIPRNVHARIERTRFDELYHQIDNEKQQRYARRLSDLNWDTDDDGHQYLHGTLKDWVPHFVNWPIEYHDIWRPWLDVSKSDAVLYMPIENAIQALQSRGNGRFYDAITNEANGAETYDLAHQISNLILFDFLTNNFDRFSGIEDYYGVNNQFANGKFISIDNGAGFQFDAREISQRRFEWITRFSRSMITTLRLMTPEIVNPILFPNPTPTEERRLQLFWMQHKKALDRVDSLIEQYGQDQVYYFP